MISAKPTSGDLLAALRQKHSECVFVPECKDGSSRDGHSRLDAWVMDKSWAHPRVVGYEIKVSRSDFINDTKWTAYLPMCNELYFAAPKGLIVPAELAPEVGLLEFVGAGRFVTKKKSPFRDIQIPDSVWRYIVMCRAVITRDRDERSNAHADMMRQWLNEKEENRKLGYLVSRKIRDHVDRVNAENDRLKRRMDDYDDVRGFLTKIGLDPDIQCGRWTVEQRLEAFHSIVPENMKQELKRLSDSLLRTQREILRWEKTTPAEPDYPMI